MIVLGADQSGCYVKLLNYDYRMRVVYMDNVAFTYAVMKALKVSFASDGVINRLKKENEIK